MELDHGNGDDVQKAFESGDDKLLAKSVFNSLEKPSIKEIPEIQKVKDMLRVDGFDIVLMSGSGSAVYALTTDYKKTHKLYKKYEKDGYDVYLTKTF